MKELTVTTKLDKLWTAADKAHAKGLDAYIEFGNACAALNDAGESQARIAERYEMSQSAVSRAIAIGADERIIRITNNDLPRSEHTLYLLTTLDDKGFKKLAKPETTQRDVQEYKATVETPKPDPEKPAKKGRPRKTATKWKRYNWRETCREEGVEVAGGSTIDALLEIDSTLDYKSQTHEQALRAACRKLLAKQAAKKGKAPEKADPSKLTKKDRTELDKALAEMKQEFYVDVSKEVEKRLPTAEKERIEKMRTALETEKRFAKLWQERVSRCKALVQSFEDNWRVIAASVHPDRPERSKEQLEKASGALNKMKSLCDDIDVKNW